MDCLDVKVRRAGTKRDWNSNRSPVYVYTVLTVPHY